MADAQKQADIVRQKAAEAAAVVKNEANVNAENLVGKAKDPISKRLAQEGAKQIKKEGETSAQKIIKEGDAKAEAVLKAAKEQGDKLLAVRKLRSKNKAVETRLVYSCDYSRR